MPARKSTIPILLLSSIGFIVVAMVWFVIIAVQLKRSREEVAHSQRILKHVTALQVLSKQQMLMQKDTHLVAATSLLMKEQATELKRLTELSPARQQAISRLLVALQATAPPQTLAPIIQKISQQEEQLYTSNNRQLVSDRKMLNLLQVITLAGLVIIGSYLFFLARGRQRIKDQFKLFTEHLHDVMLYLDKEGRVVYANRAAAAYTQTAPDQLKGQLLYSIGGFAPIAGIKTLWDATRQLPASHQEQYMEYEDLATNQFYGLSIYPAAIGYLVVCRNRTELAVAAGKNVLAEQQLVQKEEHYRHLINAISDCVFTVDANARITAVNEAVCNTTAKPAAHFIGAPLSRIIAIKPAEVQQEALSFYTRCLELQISDTLEYVDKKSNRARIIFAYPAFGGLLVISRNTIDKWQAANTARTLTEALHTKEQQYASLLKSITDGLYVLDSNWVFTHANEKLCAYFNLPMNAVAGQSFKTLFPELRHPNFRNFVAAINDAITEGKEGLVELLDLRGDYYQIRMYPHLDGVLVIYRNITDVRTAAAEKERLTKQLADSQRQYAQLAESISDGVYAIDANWTISFANMATTIADTPASLTGKNFFDIARLSLEKDYTALFQLIVHCHQQQQEGYIEVADKEDRWIRSVVVYPWKGGVNILTHDITATRRAEATAKNLAIKAAEEKARYEVFLQSVTDGIYALGRNWRFLYCNDTFARYFGHTPASLLDMDFRELWPSLNNSRFRPVYNLLEAAISQKTNGYLEVLGEDQKTWYGIRAFASETGVSVIYQDITSRKTAELQVVQLGDELNLQKERFLILEQWMTDAVLYLDQLFCIRYANTVVCRYFNLDFAQLSGRNYLQLLGTKQIDDPEYIQSIQSAVLQAQPAELIVHNVEGKYMNCRIIPVTGGTILLLHDITEQYHTQISLENARTQLEQQLWQNKIFVDSVQDGIYALDFDWKFLFANHTCVLDFGRPKEQLLGADYRTIYPGLLHPQRPGLYQKLREALEEGKEGMLHWEYQEGCYSFVRIYPSPTGVSVYYREITEEYQKSVKIGELSQTFALQNERYSTLVQAVTDGFYALDKQWRFTYANQFVCAFFNKPEASILDQPLGELWPVLYTPDFAPFYQLLHNAIELGEPGYIEIAGDTEQPATFGVWTYPSATGTSVLLKDITPQKEAAHRMLALTEKVSNQNQRYNDLINAYPDSFAGIDFDWNFTVVNEEGAHMLGQNKVAIPGRRVLDLFPFINTPAGAPLFNLYAAGLEQRKQGYLRIPIPGDGRVYDVWVYPANSGISVICRDQTAYALADAARKKLLLKVHKLSKHLQQAREEERSHLAREIHDELGQQLTGIKLGLAIQVKRCQRQLPTATFDAGSIYQMLDDTIDTVRKISANLRPPVLDEMGLMATLQWYAQRYQQQYGITIHFKIKSFYSPGKDKEIHVFRIFQESLTNIMRHAQATAITVHIACTPALFRISIRDNGKGIMEEDQFKSLGITGMRERAHLIGGKFTILPHPQKGTVVQLKARIKPMIIQDDDSLQQH